MIARRFGSLAGKERGIIHAIDCGRIRVSDMSAFADTGELDGKPAAVVASCFLVRHRVESGSGEFKNVGQISGLLDLVGQDCILRADFQSASSDGGRASKRPIANRPQDTILPHNVFYH